MLPFPRIRDRGTRHALPRIDEYARSMFAFDRPHRAWIDSCARYLTWVFGDRLVGSTVLDYAFGRGNWSLAAIKAGAERVVAVDASKTNVLNFHAFCREEGIDRIDIVEGNILEGSVGCSADILWIYGILHHIEEPARFLTGISECRRDERALALLYAYDAGSLRQAVVTSARRGVIYESEQKFIEDSFLFTPRARLRVRDDLTAPFIGWFDQARLVSLAEGAGFRAVAKVPDYSDWLHKGESDEFRPHLLLCCFDQMSTPIASEAPRARRDDIEIIAEMAEAVMSGLGPKLRRMAAIGLTNTHFSALSRESSIDNVIVEDFLYLMHCLLRMESGLTQLGKSARYYDAALRSMRGQSRDFEEQALAASALARFLQQNTIRF